VKRKRLSAAKQRKTAKVPDDVREAVWQRSDGLCEAQVPWRCLRYARTLHHKLPRSAGGPHTLDNLIAVCSFDGSRDGCHEYIHAHPAESYDRGWLIRRSA
jgi:5-methylcytosine-specific restriction endonuclease McrA